MSPMFLMDTEGYGGGTGRIWGASTYIYSPALQLYGVPF